MSGAYRATEMAGPSFTSRRGASTRRAARYDRGSRRRLKRITMRANSSVAFWIFVVGILFILFAAVPWFATHPPHHHHSE